MKYACRWPGCSRLLELPGYCEEHGRAAGRADARERGTAAQRGYGARWRRLRLIVLRNHPLCADPFGIHRERGEVVLATEVDHIIPKKAGGSDSLENLQPLCRSCHARKTAQEREGRGVKISGRPNLETGRRPRARRREILKNSPGAGEETR